ncbi:MAG: hypothetical protein QNJ29_05070 [Rhizobiaceae bacterium]|nr:hypothetical protein [Rhizobiaceae bacterium]
MKRLFISSALSLAVACTAFGFSMTSASADSCWNHNGSVMRLKASGNQRWMYYENPRQVLRNAGVRRGTLLFNGIKSGNWYSGTARRFSKFCPGNPLEYYVEGPVRSDQLEVTVRGTREVFKQCQPTGRMASDELVFTYLRDC